MGKRDAFNRRLRACTLAIPAVEALYGSARLGRKFDLCCSLFKSYQRRRHDYPLLNRYLKGMLSASGTRKRVNIEPQGYYSIKALNPNGIVPTGADMSEYGF